MVKKHSKKIIPQEEVDASDSNSDNSSQIDEEQYAESVDSDMQLAAQRDLEQGEEGGEEEGFEEEKINAFGQRHIQNDQRLRVRTQELQKSFYNRLKSKSIIKKEGRIPFTEHMTLTSKEPLNVPSQLAINDDIKREISFYNLTRENVMDGMKILVQAQYPISRPDDFLAEMLKTDQHMVKVKSRLLKQQQKQKTFEEKQLRMDNKKFHKAIKEYKMKEKHKQKKESLEAISKLKKKIGDQAAAGQDFDDKDFESNYNPKKGKQGNKNVIDTVKEKFQQRKFEKKGINDKAFKKKGKGGYQSHNKSFGKKGGAKKRPGKVTRQKSRTKKMGK